MHLAGPDDEVEPVEGPGAPEGLDQPAHHDGIGPVLPRAGSVAGVVVSVALSTPSR